MSDNLGSSIILTMAPIFVLMIGIVIYGVFKNKNKVKGQSKHETDALIEAQAMLAKYQKEQAEKAKKENKTENTKEESKNEPKAEEKPEEKSEPEEESSKEEKIQKPKADAPISDTTELEPDIDKTDDK